MKIQGEGLNQLGDLAQRYYTELREGLHGRDLPIAHRMLALSAARGRSLFRLIHVLIGEECSNETRILVRPLVEDAVNIMWICDPHGPSTLEERLFAVQFDGRLKAYACKHGVKQHKLEKLRDKGELPSQPWWDEIVDDLKETAASLGVKFATTTDPKDVLKLPERREVYERYEKRGYDLRSVELIFVDTCSATHRDGHDLNRYWIRLPGYAGEVLIDDPFKQPEHTEGERYTLLLVSTLTFMTALAAIRTSLGIKSPLEEKVDKVVKAFATADEPGA